MTTRSEDRKLVLKRLLFEKRRAESPGCALLPSRKIKIPDLDKSTTIKN
jgi:hypothetical protein